MKIDPTAEDLGREAVRAAIARNEDEFLAALEGIAQAPVELRKQVLPIYTAVGRAALMAVYKGAAPNQQQNLDMANAIRDDEAMWTPLDVRDLWEILEGFSNDQHTPKVAPERLPVAIFVVVGYLLSYYTRGAGFNSFYEYLDSILNRLVAQ